jgi:Bacterial aa3 type cytochrome c oxidase subunit IV
MGWESPTNMGTRNMADHHPEEHKHGSMDIRAQEKTFQGFIRMSVWVAAISIGILIFAGLANG